MTAVVVVDACVANKWFLPEPDAQLAKQFLSPGFRLVGPDFVLVEVANAIWKNRRLKRIGDDAATAALAVIRRYFDQLLPSEELVVEAYDFARAVDHPVYNCLYLAAARRSSAKLVTTDSVLLRKLASRPEATLAVALADWRP